MDKEEKDLQDVQETPEEEVEETTEETEELTPEQIAELKRNAEVSSQNYERAKKAETAKKELEEKLKRLEAERSDDVDDPVDDKIAELQAQLSELKDGQKLDKLYSDFPALKDKQQEFDEYREEYQGFDIQKVAKLFISEKGLDEKPLKRKGLEKAGGGTRTVPQSGKMSAKDVGRLRQNDFKQYMKLIKAGKIDIN